VDPRRDRGHIREVLQGVAGEGHQRKWRCSVPRNLRLLTESVEFQSPESVQKELREFNPIFESTPIWQTEVSEFLRMKDVQHVISSHICEILWQPFCLHKTPSNKEVDKFLEAASRSLSTVGGRSESAWRVLTLRAISDLYGSASAGSSQASSAVSRILKTLRPLTDPSECLELEKDLFSIINDSIILWQSARKNEPNLVIEETPGIDDKGKWCADDCEGTVGPSDIHVDVTHIQPLCLFPAIVQITSQGESVVAQGSALFPSSRAITQGLAEKGEHEQLLVEELLAARSRVSARKASVSTGPKSPNSSTPV